MMISPGVVRAYQARSGFHRFERLRRSLALYRWSGRRESNPPSVFCYVFR